MIRFTYALVLSLSIMFSGNIVAGGDATPWPWGTECPFPWATIEGMWKVKKVDGPIDWNTYFYNIQVVNTWDSGAHVFEITQYDMYGNEIASGRGFSSKDQRIVRALMVPVEGVDFIESHTVIIRAYSEKKRRGCADELVTVLTTRPLDDDHNENDEHFVIEKYSSSFN